jgi:hypothetical protein
MRSNLRGRISKNIELPRSNGLQPLFEAISNSIHAIEDAKVRDGQIDVEILRDAPQGFLIDGEPILNQPIIGFVIHDNGIGFTNENYESFNEEDTESKSQRGGKGIGRFLWLKAFEKAEIVSVFRQGSKRYRRSFELALTKEGIEKEELVEVNGDPLKTTVRLLGFKAEYRQYPTCPKSASTLARRIVEHFLGMFIGNRSPQNPKKQPRGAAAQTSS